MANEEKTCPLTTYLSENPPCMYEKCAWWDEDSQSCAVLTLAKAMKKRK